MAVVTIVRASTGACLYKVSGRFEEHKFQGLAGWVHHDPPVRVCIVQRGRQGHQRMQA